MGEISMKKMMGNIGIFKKLHIGNMVHQGRAHTMRLARHHEDNEPIDHESHDPNLGSAGAMTAKEDNKLYADIQQAPTGTVILKSQPDNSMHLLPVVGGTVAIFSQLYLWGNVFVALCKPGHFRLESRTVPDSNQGLPLM